MRHVKPSPHRYRLHTVHCALIVCVSSLRCAPYKLPEYTQEPNMSCGSILPAHYPLPTDYRNHGVVLSPRIKFSAVALARICKPPFGRIPPITVIPPQRIWVEFHAMDRLRFARNMDKISIAGCAVKLHFRSGSY